MSNAYTKQESTDAKVGFVAEIPTKTSKTSPIVTKSHNTTVIEKPESYVYSFCVPGAEPKDLKVEVTPDRKSLRVTGSYENMYEKRDKTNGKGFYYSYQTRSSFCNVYTLPENIDGDLPTTSLKDGVLKVEFKKSFSTSSV